MNDRNEKVELLESITEWAGKKQEPRFWREARRMSILLMALDLPTKTNNLLVYEAVSLVKLAQRTAFHDGMRVGREKALEEIAQGVRR